MAHGARSRLRRDAEEHLASARHAARRGARAGDRRPRVGAAPAHRGVGAAQRPADPAAQRHRAKQTSASRAARADARRARATGRRRRRRCSCRCRGTRAASSRGPRAAANATSTATGSTAMLAAASAPGAGWTEARAGVAARRRARRRARRSRSARCSGWLVAAGADQVGDDIGPSVRWLGRVAIWAVELTAHGAMVPLLRQRKRSSGSAREHRTARTRCAGRPRSSTRPARTPGGEHARRRVRVRPEHRRPRADPLRAHRHGRRDLPRQRPPARGARAASARAHRRRRRRSRFSPPRRQRVRRAACASPARSPHASSTGRARSPASTSGSIVRLDPPDAGDAWHLAVFASGREGRARRRSSRRSSTRARAGRDLEDETARASSACCPRCCGPGGTRRGQVDPEPGRSVGADDRRPARSSSPPASTCACPQLSRRKPTPSLRVFVDAAPESVVGANQLANVRWSAVFDDVELTAADIARLAKEARPLIRSGGRWVAIDQADLAGRGRGARRTREHHAALGRRDAAPRARPRGLAARGRRRRRRWRLGRRSARGRGRRRVAPAARARRVRRRAPQLPGRGARVARLPRHGRARRLPRARHGSRQDADDARAPARRRGHGPGAGDRAARGRRQLDRRSRALHSRAARRRAPRREPRRAPTRSRPRSPTPTSSSPPTAPRCATSTRSPRSQWARVVLDEAQAIKNPANDTSQQLRRIPARSRIALTGTPIENGLGDLWAILDFANPGLVGPRPQFIARLSSDGNADARRGRRRDARAQRHPRVPPHQGRARRSRPSCPTRSTSSTTAR